MAAAPLQSAMAMFSSLLSPQPPPPPSLQAYQHKPLPKAPSAPVSVPHPLAKPNLNNPTNDPAPNAYSALIATTPPSNSSSTICEVCDRRSFIDYNNIYSYFCSHVTFDQSTSRAERCTISALSDVPPQQRPECQVPHLEIRVKVQLAPPLLSGQPPQGIVMFVSVITLMYNHTDAW